MSKQGAVASRSITTPEPLPAAALRWRCDPAGLPFDSTDDVEPAGSVIGQDTALEALRFGLETNAPGQNIYVRGLQGTGRLTLVRNMLLELALTSATLKDCLYVYNFAQPDRPSLITLPAGRGDLFRRRVDRLIEFIRDDLAGVLSSEGIKARRTVIDQAAEQKAEAIIRPFEQALHEAGLALVRFQAGPVTQTAIFPLVEGKPTPPEEYEQLRADGKISEDQYKLVRAAGEQFEQQLATISEQVNQIRREHGESVRTLLSNAARYVLGRFVREIEAEFPEERVHQFLGAVINDVVDQRLDNLEKTSEFARLYRVNVVLEHRDSAGCPVILENTPTPRHLLGTIDYEIGPGDEFRANHLGVRAGALLRADGGYLILDARDVLSEPGAWKVLVRTLRTGRLEIVPPEMIFPWMGPSLKPEPIEVRVKVVLLGDPYLYYLLDEYDPDFPQLFKVLADFDSMIPRVEAAVHQYATVLARIARDEKLPAFDRTAVAALAEHGARIAARRGKLTARFGRLADIAREAAFLAAKETRPRVTAADVKLAVRRGRQRADLPLRRFLELVRVGVIRVATRGEAVGQINGLAILQAGPLTYGFPSRITATIGVGTAGVINIEREAALSGAIHTKGFYILGGLLRNLLRTEHPLALDGSIAFEQSYGGIDGDSASGAEICCLLSALTETPIRQDLAMTGAIDQVGNLLAIGGVNEKIEGFFDACSDAGLTGTQGVIIPRDNAGDLMLREDVVETCASGRFHVFTAATVQESLAILTGRDVGMRDANGRYLHDSTLGIAVRRAREYWEMSVRNVDRDVSASQKAAGKTHG